MGDWDGGLKRKNINSNLLKHAVHYRQYTAIKWYVSIRTDEDQQRNKIAPQHILK